MLVVAIVIVFLIATNALYVAAEFAAVGVRRSRIAQLAEEGNRFARYLLPIVDDNLRLDRYIATCQIGITLSSIILGAYGQSNVAQAIAPLFVSLGGFQEAAAQTTSTILILLLFTGMQMVLGELVPKSLALQFPTQVALYTVLPMRWSLWIFHWFIEVLNGSGSLILRLLRIPQVGHRHIHSPDEIAMIVTESRNGGLLEPDEQLRLHRALRLELRTAGQLSVPRRNLVAFDVNTSLQEAKETAVASPYTRFPVYEGQLDQIVGLAHTKDLVRRYLEHGLNGTVRDILRPIPIVPETMTADHLLKHLRESRSQQAAVVDERGGLTGLVTLEDILSEVVGAVGDEFKAGEPDPEILPDGRIRLPGLLLLDEVEPLIGSPWTGNVDTVGGLVAVLLQRIPVTGDRLIIDGRTVEVEAVENYLVQSVLVDPVLEGQETDA